MSLEGKTNTLLGIQGLVKALVGIRETVIRATADGDISREERVEIFSQLAMAVISEGLKVALSVASNKIKP